MKAPLIGRKQIRSVKDHGITVGVRCPQPLLSMIDEYRRSEPDLPPRASALRRLALLGLKVRKTQA
jgi:hypothetical protein